MLLREGEKDSFIAKAMAWGEEGREGGREA